MSEPGHPKTRAGAAIAPEVASPRNLAIDLARGLAVLLMIQTHVYDSWVRVVDRASTGFAVTRFLGVLPLPTFLVLAGIGTALRVDAGERRGETASRVRHDLVRRGLEVIAAGYGVSLVLGILDGASNPSTFLRIDVLHAIGLSIVLSALTLVGGGQSVTSRRLLGGGLTLALVLSLLSIPGTQLGAHTEGVARWFVAPFVSVPGLTKMPLVPLGAWVGIGSAFGATWLRRPRSQRAHALLALFAVLVAYGAAWATTATHHALGGTLDRAHPAIVFNVLDLGARAIALIAVVLASTAQESRTGTPSRLATELATIGRHSMLAYAIHLPFAYGRIAHPFTRQLSMGEATFGLVVVVGGTWAAMRLKDVFERKTRGSPGVRV